MKHLYIHNLDFIFQIAAKTPVMYKYIQDMSTDSLPCKSPSPHFVTLLLYIINFACIPGVDGDCAAFSGDICPT